MQVFKFVQKFADHFTINYNLLTWTKWWARASASKWRMGFNSAFKGLIIKIAYVHI